jgi:hypothetical protein
MSRVIFIVKIMIDRYVYIPRYLINNEPKPNGFQTFSPPLSIIHSGDLVPGEMLLLEYPFLFSERFSDGITKDEYTPLVDLYNTVQMIAKYCVDGLGDSENGIVRNILKACHQKSVSEIRNCLIDFNEVVTKNRASFECRKDPAPLPLISHILEQSYARTVALKSHMLNSYQGFSNNVYGEIKSTFIHDIIKNAQIKSTDFFLDMVSILIQGSGIGNVVLQVAAECLCRSFGIEIMENPATLAKRQKIEFLSRMR